MVRCDWLQWIGSMVLLRYRIHPNWFSTQYSFVLDNPLHLKICSICQLLHIHMISVEPSASWKSSLLYFLSRPPLVVRCFIALGNPHIHTALPSVNIQLLWPHPLLTIIQSCDQGVRSLILALPVPYHSWFRGVFIEGSPCTDRLNILPKPKESVGL